MRARRGPTRAQCRRARSRRADYPQPTRASARARLPRRGCTAQAASRRARRAGTARVGARVREGAMRGNDASVARRAHARRAHQFFEPAGLAVVYVDVAVRARDREAREALVEGEALHAGGHPLDETAAMHRHVTAASTRLRVRAALLARLHGDRRAGAAVPRARGRASLSRRSPSKRKSGPGPTATPQDNGGGLSFQTRLRKVVSSVADEAHGWQAPPPGPGLERPQRIRSAECPFIGGHKRQAVEGGPKSRAHRRHRARVRTDACQ